jgi:hypothetical protein
MVKAIDISGMKFGRVIPIKRCDYNDKNGNPFWECKCDCGTIFVVRSQCLKSGHTKSCGCLLNETTIKTHTKHNMSRTRPYTIWTNMLSRCSYEKYEKNLKNYIKRGITVCNEWKTFDGFWKDMSEGYADNLSIDRINNDKGYDKNNCRWATSEQQNNNSRINRFLSYEGTTLSVRQWAKKLNIQNQVILSRIKSGRPIEEILSPNPLKYKYAPKEPKPLVGFICAR